MRINEVMAEIQRIGQLKYDGKITTKPGLVLANMQLRELKEELARLEK